MKQSFLRGEITFAKSEGIDRKYLKVTEMKERSMFEREIDKPEASVRP